MVKSVCAWNGQSPCLWPKGGERVNHHIKRRVGYVSLLLAPLLSASLCCWLLAAAQRNSLVASVNITFGITVPEPPCVDLTQFLGPCCVAWGFNGQNNRSWCLSVTWVRDHRGIRVILERPEIWWGSVRSFSCPMGHQRLALLKKRLNLVIMSAREYQT